MLLYKFIVYDTNWTVLEIRLVAGYRIIKRVVSMCFSAMIFVILSFNPCYELLCNVNLGKFLNAHKSYISEATGTLANEVLNGQTFVLIPAPGQNMRSYDDPRRPTCVHGPARHWCLSLLCLILQTD